MPGLVFQMSQVVIADNTKTKYNSAPKTEVVSMTQTTWKSCLASGKAIEMAEPNIPVAESMGIEHEQHFDSLALVHSISELNYGGRSNAGKERVRFKIVLNDGSENKDTGKVCHLPVTIFVDGELDGQPPPLYQQLQSACNQNLAMAFFGIQGKNPTPMMAHGSSRRTFHSSANKQVRPKRDKSWKAKRLRFVKQKVKRFHCQCIQAGILNRMNRLQTWKQPRPRVHFYNP